MNIPIRNLYYMFLYAWGYFTTGRDVATGIDQSPDLPDLFAKVLLEGTNRLLRRGLDRGYRGVTEYTRSPRGRLRFDRMAKEQTLFQGIAVCDVDDFTPDVLHNQILRATLMALANCSDIEVKRRHDLRLTALRMGDVSEIRLSAGLFRRVQLSRHSAHYGLLIKICEFVFWSLMPDERGAEARFKSILEDEVRMSAVFEEFLRRFYQIEQSHYRVRSEIMNWHLTAPTQSDISLLPVMKTDLTFRSDDHMIIADAKYYRKTLGGGRYGAKLQSQHLYQLFTYLSHAGIDAESAKVSGMLIYPQVGPSLRLHYEFLGFPVMIVTVDLSQEWREIHGELIELLEAA